MRAPCSPALLSFLSPCVLPLVPPYLCFIGGVTFEQLTDDQQAEAGLKRRVLLAAFAFVLGFAVVLHSPSAQRPPWLVRPIARHYDLLGQDRRWDHHRSRPALSRPVFKIAFLAARSPLSSGTKTGGPDWRLHHRHGLRFRLDPLRRPCAGRDPIRRRQRGVRCSTAPRYCSVYALGIGLPFILAAAAIGPFMTFMQRFRRLSRPDRTGHGRPLVLTGVLFITGSMNEIGFLAPGDVSSSRAYWLIRTFDLFSNRSRISGQKGT